MKTGEFKELPALLGLLKRIHSRQGAGTARVSRGDACAEEMRWINIHNETLFSREKEGNSAVCDHMGGPPGIVLSDVSQPGKDRYWELT